MARSLTCVAFLVAIALTSGLILKLLSLNIFSKSLVMAIGFSIEIAYFVLIWILGDQIYEEFESDTILTKWQIILLACITGASMGVHNAVAKEAIPNCPSTTVMTMTLVSVGQLSSQTFEYFLASKKLITLRPCVPSTCRTIELDEAATTAYYTSMETKFKESLGKFIIAFKPLFAFIVGALIGSGVTEYSKFTGLIIPIFWALIICIDSYIKVYIENRNSTPAYNAVAGKADIELAEKQTSKL